MSLPAGQIADKIYLPTWIFNLPWAPGQPLMSHPAVYRARNFLCYFPVLCCCHIAVCEKWNMKFLALYIILSCYVRSYCTCAAVAVTAALCRCHRPHILLTILVYQTNTWCLPLIERAPIRVLSSCIAESMSAFILKRIHVLNKLVGGTVFWYRWTHISHTRHSAFLMFSHPVASLPYRGQLKNKKHVWS